MRVIVISATSDIGTALCKQWIQMDWQVDGTFRTASSAMVALNKAGVRLVPCDLSEVNSVDQAGFALNRTAMPWDILVLCPGQLEPIGAFTDVLFEQWANSININFTAQLQLLHALLPSRNVKNPLGPCVLFFAGSGSNSAPINYSAYTVSKIALTKMTELLDAEISDTRFVIVGPGWVKTKIHAETLAAGVRAGTNYHTTKQKLKTDDCVHMNKVLECCNWIIESPRLLVGGRNFSVAYDAWDQPALNEALKREPHMYKLRRFGNGWEA